MTLACLSRGRFFIAKASLDLSDCTSLAYTTLADDDIFRLGVLNASNLAEFPSALSLSAWSAYNLSIGVRNVDTKSCALPPSSYTLAKSFTLVCFGLPLACFLFVSTRILRPVVRSIGPPSLESLALRSLTHFLLPALERRVDAPR